MFDKNQMAEVRRANLLAWMESNSITRTELAAKLEVGRAYISLLFKPDRFFGEKSARSIEKKLFMPTGFLDSNGSVVQSVVDWSTPTELPDGVFALVPRVSVSLAAGPGQLPVDNQSLPPLAFRKDWLSKKMVTGRDSLRIVEVRGDSMEEYLQDGDLVLIDVSQNTVLDNEVYAMRYGDELRIKRLSRRFDGGLIIRSDNTRYSEESVAPEHLTDIEVIGRVLWRGG